LGINLNYNSNQERKTIINPDIPYAAYDIIVLTKQEESIHEI